jgi:hypothetical protein
MTDRPPDYRRIGRCIRAMGTTYHSGMVGAVLALQRMLKEERSSLEELAGWIESWAEYETMAVIPAAEAVAAGIEADERAAEQAEQIAAAQWHGAAELPQDAALSDSAQDEKNPALGSKLT